MYNPLPNVVDRAVTSERRPAVERIVSGIGAIFRPIAKELIKGGIVVGEAVSELASETGEKFKDLLAEAKSELEKPESQGQETNKTDDKDDN
jgi:ribosomal protein S19E (S16A)